MNIDYLAFTSMMSEKQRVKIIATPPGEAPEDIREAWVGLELPLAKGKYQEPKEVRGWGVLSGPRTILQMLAATLFRRFPVSKSFVIETEQALEILGANNRSAADWWKTNASHLFTVGSYFAFPIEVCELIDYQSATDV